MKRSFLALCLFSVTTLSFAAPSYCADSDGEFVLIVVGAGGQDQYTKAFETWGKRWQTACREAKLPHATIGLSIDTEMSDIEQLKFEIQKRSKPSDSPIWIVLIGHGTALGDVAKFNLRGPDISAEQLATILQSVQRPVVVINCASSSGPFLVKLTDPNRVIVTATQSGAERNYARFGDYLSTAITDPSADLDHDDQVSLLEAFLTASKRVQQFYDDESRLATEHALLDDNGDGKGTPATFFEGTRATGKSTDASQLDGQKANKLVILKSDTEESLSDDQDQSAQ